MYADHGARHYLATGHPDQALALAEANFAQRQDLGAHLLLLEARWADGQQTAACTLRDRIVAAGFAPPELDLLETSGDLSCAPRLVHAP